VGARAETRAWDDPAVDWRAADLAVIRSTWNYVRNHQAFLAWVDRCAAQTRLWNPPQVVRWNSHKGYLLELAARGLPVVPTRLVHRGSEARLVDLMEWDEVVVKPAISAGSFGTVRVKRDELDRGQAHLASMLRDHDMMVQPYFPSVESHGERSLVCIDGQLTHEIRKGARFAGDGQRVSGPLPVGAEERAVAERVLAEVSWPLLYARVDLARDAQGRPHLMELELIEPSLFLQGAPHAAERLAAAIVRRAA
jgi:glutathione synthase/RimK-type ligase-like ATP-grasp enzyme